MSKTVKVLAVLLLAWTSIAYAQGRPFEISLEAGAIGFSSGGGSAVFVVNIPDPVLSFGIPIAEKVSFEPVVQLDFTAVENASFLLVGLSLGVPFYFKNARDGFFVRPFGGMSFINADASGVGDSDAQFGLGLGFGVKVPVGSQVSLRFDVPLSYVFESEYRSDAFSAAVAMGFSIFLR